jgi:hypothetical protein
MEMTFPPAVPSQNSVDGRTDHIAMLAAAAARQANSRTVRAVRRTAGDATAKGDATAQRIDYFASKKAQNVPVCGAFWRQNTPGQIGEDAVYQADSGYIKDSQLKDEATGVEPTHAGHRVSRTL